MANIRNKAARSEKPEPAHKTQHIRAQPASLEAELIQLIDDFAEFSELSAFLCHAYTTSLSDPKWLTPEIMSGARLCSLCLQSRTTRLKHDLRQIHTGINNSKTTVATKTRLS